MSWGGISCLRSLPCCLILIHVARCGFNHSKFSILSSTWIWRGICRLSCWFTRRHVCWKCVWSWPPLFPPTSTLTSCPASLLELLLPFYLTSCLPSLLLFLLLSVWIWSLSLSLSFSFLKFFILRSAPCGHISRLTGARLPADALCGTKTRIFLLNENRRREYHEIKTAGRMLEIKTQRMTHEGEE